MLTVVTYKWGTRYTDTHIIKLASMFAEFLPGARFICFSDTPKPLPGVDEVLPLPTRFMELGGCYLRMWMYSYKAEPILGTRVLHCDLDTVLFKDFTPCIDDSLFKIWKCPSLGKHGFAYGPGLSLFTPGGFEVYEWFCKSPRERIIQARKAGWTGTDQGVIGHYIHPHGSVWTEVDGIYSYRDHIIPGGNQKPDNMVMLGFYGNRYDPSTCDIDWVREVYNNA